MLFNYGNNFVDTVVDGFCVTIFGDADARKIKIVLVECCQNIRNRADKSDTGAFGRSGFMAVDAIGEVSSACDASHLGKITD